MNIRKHFERQIARWIETVSRAASAEGLHITTERCAGEVRVQVKHPTGPVALTATFTSPPATAPSAPAQAPASELTPLETFIRQRRAQAEPTATSTAPAAPPPRTASPLAHVDDKESEEGEDEEPEEDEDEPITENVARGNPCHDCGAEPGEDCAPDCEVGVGHDKPAPPKLRPEAPAGPECFRGEDFPAEGPQPKRERATDVAPPEATTQPPRRWLYGLSVGALADLADDALAALEVAGLPDLILFAPRRASGMRYRGWWFARFVANTDALYAWAAAWKVLLLTAEMDDASAAEFVTAASVAQALPVRLAREQDVAEQAAAMLAKNERGIRADAKKARAEKKATKAAPDETTRAGKKAAKKLPKGTKGAR